MIRIGTLSRPTLNPWRVALAGAAVVAAIGFAAAHPAKADDVQRPAIGSNYEQYEHDARVHSMQLTESRAADAEAQTDRALAAEQAPNQRAAGPDLTGAWQARLGTPDASSNQ